MDHLNMSYKQLHENFMQNHTGTSLLETVIIQTPLPLLIFLALFAVNYVKKYKHLIRWFDYLCVLLEFVIIVVTQILLYNLPRYRSHIYGIIYTACFSLITYIFYGCINIRQRQRINLMRCLVSGKRPFVTFFRASVNLSTTICILAVDFPSFPRTLAKTETFGFSLMDTGVGYFVVCSALVTNHQFESDFVKGSLFLIKQMKNNFVLLLLGLVRLAFTKLLDYQTHNTEYGVHWNFFLTLACVRLFSTIILTYIKRSYVKYVSIFIIAMHQLSLASDVQEWVLSDAPRDSFLSANREGLVSLLGYIGIYVISVEIRHKLVLQKSSVESDIRTFFYTFLCTGLLFVLASLLDNYFPCSRRLVNVTYIVWIIMLSLYLLSLSLFVEILLRVHDGINSKISNHSPVLLDSINFNGMSYFLLANLLTGLVNLSVKTLYVSNFYSIIILIIYMFVSCSVVCFLYYKKYRLI